MSKNGCSRLGMDCGHEDRLRNVTNPQRPDPTTPGWYPSPVGNSTLTYWDGAGWTDRTRPRGVSPLGLVVVGLLLGLLGGLGVTADAGLIALVALVVAAIGSVVTLVGAIALGVVHGLQHAQIRRWE